LLGDAPKAISNDTLAAIMQQVVQSGLLKEFPRWITTVSSALAACIQQYPSIMPASGDRQEMIKFLDGTLKYKNELPNLSSLAQQTLVCQRALSALWAPGTPSFSHMVPCAVCALGLARTALKCDGSLLNRAPDGSAAELLNRRHLLGNLMTLHYEAHNCVLEAARQVCSAPAAGYLQPLLACPHLLPCVVITCASLALAEPAKLKAAAAAAARDRDSAVAASSRSSSNNSSGQDGTVGRSSSRSSSSDGFSDSTTQQHAAQACADVVQQYCHVRSWELAGQLVGQVSTCQLKLFELLGVDPLMMLWFASSVQQALKRSECLPWWSAGEYLQGAVRVLS
jgi:hypothetical protein